MNRNMMVMGLKGLVILFGVMVLVFFFVFVPQLGREMALAAPEYAWAFWPCLIFAWVFMLPIVAAAFPAWQIFDSLREKGRAFCRENAHRFHLIGHFSTAAAVIFLAGILLLAAQGAGSAPLMFLIMPLVVLAGCAFAFACHVMGKLVEESADMKEENELTI